MRFEPTDIAGLTIVHLERNKDQRGSFARLFCQDEFEMHGLVTRFVQQSLSVTTQAGTLRGMHFQRTPLGETKYVRCIRGVIYDVVADLRPESPSYLRWRAFHLSEGADFSLYIPGGCAHGFQTVTDSCEVLYQMDTIYCPEAAAGFRFDDPALQIEWRFPITLIAERDLAWPPLSP